MASFSDDLPRVETTPLAPPPGSFDAVRRRARTRRQRRAAAVGGGMVAVLALGVIGGAALTSSEGRRTDSLVATAPSAGPTASATPSPSPSPTAVPRPSRPAPQPSTAASSVPAAPSPEVTPPTAVLLDVAAVEAATGSEWEWQEDWDMPFPLLMACSEGGPPASDGALRPFTRDGVLLQQQLLRYPDADAARAALARLVEEVRRCPTRAEDSEDGQASVDHALKSATHERATVVETSRDCDTCTERRYELLVAVVDRAVVLLRSNDPDLPLPALLDAARR